LMLIVIALALCLAVTGMVVFIVLCAGIRREDRSAGLGGQVTGRAAVLARRFTGLRTEQPGVRGPRSRRQSERAGADA
jgi:hypothetical protein